MLIQWFVISGAPLVYVTADTRIACMRLAFEIGALLPEAAVVTPKKDPKTLRWSQGFALKNVDPEVAAQAVAAAVKHASAVLRAEQLTPARGTSMDLIKETK